MPVSPCTASFLCSGYAEFITASRDSIRIIVGCAPCQPYSNYSRGHKSIYEERWHLIGAYQKLVEGVCPELVTIENVVQLRKHPSYHELVRGLAEAGYHWSEYEVRCEEYGVPQTRTRLVAFASIFGPVELAEASCPDGDYATVRDAIGHLPPVSAGGNRPERSPPYGVPTQRYQPPAYSCVESRWHVA